MEHLHHASSVQPFMVPTPRKAIWTYSSLDQIEHGDSDQQRAAIDQLLALAEQSNEPSIWNVAALAIHRLRRFDEEIEILSQLVANVASADVYRLSLATAYSQVESIDLCRFHLRTLVDHASTEEMRRIGEEQLRGYESFLGPRNVFSLHVNGSHELFLSSIGGAQLRWAAGAGDQPTGN